ncbi:MAG: hypothetical protein ABJA71_00675 [Ginsengibacter sp.]
METANPIIKERLKKILEHSTEVQVKLENNEFTGKEAKLISKELDREMREITALLMATDMAAIHPGNPKYFI